MVIPTLPSINLIEQDPFTAAWQMEVARAEAILATLTEKEQDDFISGLQSVIDACGDVDEYRLFVFITFNDAHERKG